MFAKKINGIKPIDNYTAKEHLDNIVEEFTKNEKEIPFEIQQTKEYLNKLNKKMTKTKEKEIRTKLAEYNLSEKIIIELLNIIPETEDNVKTILYKQVEADDNLIKKILAAFK